MTLLVCRQAPPDAKESRTRASSSTRRVLETKILRCACRFGSYFDGPKDICHAAYLEEAFALVRYIDDEIYKVIVCEYRNMYICIQAAPDLSQ